MQDRSSTMAIAEPRSGLRFEAFPTPLHRRTIEMDGFQRSDGLYQLHAVLRDSKSYDFTAPGSDQIVRAGDAIHHMSIDLITGKDLLVHVIKAKTFASPYPNVRKPPPRCSRSWD